MKIKLDRLAAEVTSALDTYRDSVKSIVAEEVKATAKEAAEDLRGTSPERTGDYARSWTYKTERGGGAEVYAKAPHYRVTHLLEYGHINRDGTRTAPRPHIEAARDKAEENLTERLVKRL